MKSRIYKTTLTSFIVLFSLGIAACNSSSGNNTHHHTYSSEWSFDETYHWHDSTCGHDVVSDKGEHTFKETIIEPDYEHQGYTKHECTVCGYSYNDTYVDPLAHHYSDAWSSDDEYHWHACIDEGYETLFKDRASHRFGNWIIDEAATEEKDGTRHHVCLDCQKSVSETYKYSKAVKATRVYLSNASSTLVSGFTYNLNPVVFPNEAENKVAYEVSNPNVLSISGNVATGLNAGSTLVYAYNDEDSDGVRDTDEAFTVISFAISERDSSKSVTVEESASVAVGDTKKLNYSSSGISAMGMEYGFYSEDESICTISAGTIKGHKPGTTKVSVSLQGYRAYCTVTVTDKTDSDGLRASSISAPQTLVLSKGQSTSISYNILPSGTVDTLKTVTSNNTSVKVNEDKSITAIKGGSATVTLTTTNGKFARVLVTVKDDAQQASSYYNNYYGDLTWENGADLKAKLHNIISKNVTPLKYDSPNWETNQYADQDLYDYSYVKGVYSDTPILKTATNDGWQREHGFAASLMTGFSTGSAVKSLGRSTDFHNLFAAQAGANGSRGNKNIGYVNPESVEYTTKENCEYTRKVWEPDDSDKGRMARAILYMGVMYNQEEVADVTETWTYKGDDTSTHSGKTKAVHTNVKEQPLQIVESNIDYSRISLDTFMAPSSLQDTTLVNYYRSLIKAENPTLEESDYDTFRELAYERYLEKSMPYAIGYLSDLVSWNSFPVDHLEVQHNESVYSHASTAGKGTQGNRNPFVDYPELVEYVYGDLKDQPGSLSMLTPTYETIEMNKDEIHHYSVESGTLPAFKSGTKPSVSDFNIKAIKNDLSVGTLDTSKIHVEDYTFTDADVETGKTITITTDKNTLMVPVKVTSDSIITFDNCKFSYKPSAGNRSDYSGSGTSYVATFDGVKFDVTFGQSTSTFQNKGTGGVTIGSKNNPIGSLTFESQSSYTNVNALFFYAAPSATGYTITYKVYVGDVEKLSGSLDSTTMNVSGGTFSNASGKVKVEFTSVKGIVFAGLAFNY